MNDSIFHIAQAMQKKYHTRDPYRLLEAMGVTVEQSDVLPENGLKGFCTILNKTRYVVVNAHLGEEEQKVVVAHEAGHMVLHKKELNVKAFRDSDIYMAKSTKEREANVFAADFLFSDEDVLDAMNSCGANFFTVAQALCIPEPFFAFKLYSMVERGHAMKMPVELNNTFLAR